MKQNKKLVNLKTCHLKLSGQRSKKKKERRKHTGLKEHLKVKQYIWDCGNPRRSEKERDKCLFKEMMAENVQTWGEKRTLRFTRPKSPYIG